MEANNDATVLNVNRYIKSNFFLYDKFCNSFDLNFHNLIIIAKLICFQKIPLMNCTQWQMINLSAGNFITVVCDSFQII